MSINRQHKKIKPQSLLKLALVMALAPASAMAGPSFQVGDEGSMQIDYSLQIWSQFKDFSSSGDTFDTYLRRNRLTFYGQYNDYVSYYAQIEAGGDSRDGNDDKATYYRDAYITVDYSDPVRLIAGRFKNTFTRENLEACLNPLTLDRAQTIAYTPFGGTRDTGVALWGNLADAAFQYRLMIADGREGDAVPKDSPRFTARVHWSPLSPEYDYGYRGTYLGTQEVFTIGAAIDQQANVAYGDTANSTDLVDYSATTVDVFYEKPTDSGTFTVSAAAMEYKTDNAINKATYSGTLPVTTELEASYIKGAYLMPEKMGIGRLQVFGRYETSDYKYTAVNLDQTWTSVGLNYYIDGERLKATVEYANIDFDQENVALSLEDTSQITFGFQMIF